MAKAPPAIRRPKQRQLKRTPISNRVLMTPEGLPLLMTLAGHDVRIEAFLIDMGIMGTSLAVFILTFVFLFDLSSLLIITIIQFGTFLITNLYFIYFELAWQGRTPGKKCYNLRVVNSRGGELTPAAIVARNLTRQVEIFLPLSLLLQNIFILFIQGVPNLAFCFWALILSGLPLFNKNRSRAGDLLAGTIVVAMPKRVLLTDLSQQQSKDTFVFTFSPSQLSIYGGQELQVLENILRKISEVTEPSQKHLDKALATVCQKICQKIDYPDPVPPYQIRRFLSDFYKAQRAQLERGLIFGHLKVNKNTKPLKPPNVMLQKRT